MEREKDKKNVDENRRIIRFAVVVFSAARRDAGRRRTSGDEITIFAWRTNRGTKPRCHTERIIDTLAVMTGLLLPTPPPRLRSGKRGTTATTTAIRDRIVVVVAAAEWDEIYFRGRNSRAAAFEINKRFRIGNKRNSRVLHSVLSFSSDGDANNGPKLLRAISYRITLGESMMTYRVDYRRRFFVFTFNNAFYLCVPPRTNDKV